MRAAVYTRISDDVAGLGLGVARQEADCRQLCEAKGWSVVDVYRDNDRSAFSGKPRPEYERLLEDVKAGTLDVICAWHPDRLHRSPLELEGFIELTEIADVAVVTVQAGNWDLTTSGGRLVARQLGSVARYESEVKRERIKSKHRQLAESGVFVSGSRRPFGYTWKTTPGGQREGLKVNPGEAKLIKEAARRVRSGESLYAVVGDWTARGVPTVTGSPWRTKTLAQILCSGRIAGWRDRHGEPFVRSDQWQPVIDEDTWRAVRAILLDPARKRTRVARRYLLGQGVLRCGVCGSKMVASPQRKAGGDLVPRYGCRSDKGGCGKVSVLAEPVDAIVSDALCQALSDPAFLSRLGGGDKDDDRLQRTQIAELEASLEELSRDYYADKLISRAEFVAARDRLVPDLDAAKATLAATTRRAPRAVLRGIEDVAAQWDTLGLDRQRALVELCIESVTIESVRGRGTAGRFEASRVGRPVWRA